MIDSPVIDLTRNIRQAEFFNAVMESVKGSAFRYFAYGGGIRGGKTYVCLFIFIVLARMFPNSRWHVIRKDMPLLKSTTIPSFSKLAPKKCRWHRDSGNYHVEFPNGSKIFFKPESVDQDPELKDFLGLETNGFFLDQAEEINRLTFERAKERTGSWYIDPMPPALILFSFNPTDEWVRPEIYEPFINGTLQAPFYFTPALASDNPFVTQDQWDTWAQLDPISYRKMIEGDWDAQRTENNFYYAFSRTKHVDKFEFNPELPVHLSFDQNVLPYITMTCYQVKYGNRVMIGQFDEFCLEHPQNTTGSLCQAFMDKYGKIVKHAYLYGDASGNKHNTVTHQTDYSVAKTILRPILNNSSDRTFRANPSIINRREWLNNVLSGKYDIDVVIDHGCSKSIRDLQKTATDANGHKLKKKVKGPNGQSFEPFGHTSDTFDYVMTKVFQAEFDRYCDNRFSIISSVGY